MQLESRQLKPFWVILSIPSLGPFLRLAVRASLVPALLRRNMACSSLKLFMEQSCLRWLQQHRCVDWCQEGIMRMINEFVQVCRSCYLPIDHRYPGNEPFRLAQDYIPGGGDSRPSLLEEHSTRQHRRTSVLTGITSNRGVTFPKLSSENPCGAASKVVINLQIPSIRKDNRSLYATVSESSKRGFHSPSPSLAGAAKTKHIQLASLSIQVGQRSSLSMH
ncbi:hypothetical protein EDC04DRAFT_2710841, partial [Pisolithus marmoratus]